MDSIQYECKEGDRWDTVSWYAYGTTDKTKDIILANPNVMISDRLPAGTILDIPIVEDNTIKSDTEKLPPWKQ